MLKFFTCFFLTIALVFAVTNCNAGTQADIQPESYIRVDQFGYRPQDPKVAVIVDPEVGFNGEEEVSPGTTYEVWDADSEQKVYSGTITPWMDGQVHSQSGDRAWWFDFSEVRKPGSYYILDGETGERSFEFDIAEDVYRDVLIAATRTYYYQRSGFPKQEPYADPRWTDGAAFLGPGQDTEARFVYDKDNPELARDMRGGWFDAGDTNKYVTFANQPVHQLLSAYSQNPEIWTDDFNIPESGNNIPDLIDELKFELDWLKRMQDDDGGVFIKLGTIDYNSARRPSLDKRPRYYAPKCSSASIATAGMFAHAALVFQEFPALKSYAEDLQKRAIAAWNWYEKNPKSGECDSQTIKAGDADRSIEEQKARSVASGVYLFALTGEQKYEDAIRENIGATRAFNEDTWSRYEPLEGDAMLFYTRLQKGDEALKKQIRDRFAQMVVNNKLSYGLNPSLDPYRAYMTDPQYHWGSNQVESNYGNTNYDALLYDIDPNNRESYKSRALAHINYVHGVNPLNMVYLSNMYEYGAEKSANEIYHEWFGGGIYDNALTSPSGPAPGYLTGGPNHSYTGEAKPPAGEPRMKSYFDENDPKQKSWEITEPAIYYQSSYIKLLSNFVGSE
ncbi:glycoside hydrolase family 9 protein [Lyngbya sp. CCY1209]|uniref:glycoside hydrolase family 9 protein n=1 Tax=Lyngbya sp. CCY1209 TaxID=2886103 RepID=UPI002D206D90|nr:glycoside hydrolase family 9 protein [Lyngbya sp. CCY1209]MEB3884782.1 glycoside hydrolase family 9 protein [Lyngbya sp. CCY1209]